MDDALTLEDLRRLRRTDPRGLHALLEEARRGFLFGVEDRRGDPEAWGGELRVVINRNVAVHFVPRLNAAMTSAVELPQFSVVPSAERSDAVDDTVLRLEEGEEVHGATFYVDPTEYDALVGDAERVLERYEDWEVIPDTYFLDGPLVRFLDRVVLEHPAVRAEREYDFRRGFVGGEAPPPAEEEAEPAPDLAEWEQAGPTYAFTGEDQDEDEGDDDEEDEDGADEDEEDEDEEDEDEEDEDEEDEEDEDEEDEDGPDEDAQDDDDAGGDGRGEHFRTWQNPRGRR